MSYKALYRKYRPTTFEEVVGQDYIIKALIHTLKQNKIAHAYLFCGTRGTGKTSVAKILAKSVNCLDAENAPCNVCSNCIASDEGTNPDIIELDAASNNSVDNVRDIIEQLKYAPFQSRYKVYIIDEVHMLSTSAFNALLKTLEEPPKNVIFILATTEPHKVLPTIISRCQRFDFLRVDKDSIIQRLTHVSNSEKLNVSEKAKKLIADLAEGGMRDALSILDQCVAYTGEDSLIDENVIKEIYGLTSTQDKINLLKLIHQKQAKEVLNQLKEFLVRGVDFKRLTHDLINILKELILYSYTRDESVLDTIEKDSAKEILNRYDESSLLEMIDILMNASESYYNALNIFSYFEVLCLKLMNVEGMNVIENNSSKLLEVQEIEETQEEEIITFEEEDLVQEVVNVEESEEKLIQEELNEFEEQDIQEEKQEEIVKEELTLDLELMEDLEQDIQPEIEPIDYYDNETLLQLVVQCTKDQRIEDETRLNSINNYRHDFNLAKYVNLLNKTQIAASGNDCLLVKSEHEAIVNHINEKQMNKELYEFILNELNIDKMIFALTDNQYKTILDLYRLRVADGTLPKPYKVIRYKIEKEIPIEIEPIERVINLFGSEYLEIIEEDK